MRDRVELIWNEVKLLFKLKMVIVLILLTIIFMIIGLGAVNSSDNYALHNMRQTSRIIALGSARYGALFGSVLFGMMTIILLNRDQRKGSKDLIEANLEYYQLIIVRIISLILLVIGTILLGMLVVFIVQTWIYQTVFELRIYLFSYGVVLFPAILFAILLTSGVYLITDNSDMSLLSLAGLYFLSLTSNNYLLNWVQTHALLYSDFASIRPVTSFILYNRLFWVSISLGVLALGLLFKRRYQRGIYESMLINGQKLFIPLAVVGLLCLALLIYSHEPLINSADSALNIEEPVINERVILTKILPDITFYPDKGEMKAVVNYIFFKLLAEERIELITNTGLQITSVKVNGLPTGFEYLKGTDRIQVDLADGEQVELEVIYEGRIKYPHVSTVAGYISENSIYLLEQSHWIFEPLTARDEQVEIIGAVTLPAELTAVPVGEITAIKEEAGQKTWEYMLKTRSLELGFFAAEYTQKIFNAAGIEVQLFTSPRHEAYLFQKDLEHYITGIVEYYTQVIGEYAFLDQPLKIVESSLYKTGGHSTANVITIAEYVFNREFTNSTSMEEWRFYQDIELLAHEIAHQWWGSGVEVTVNTPWSSEGLACYMSNKYMEAEFGEEVSFMLSSYWESSVRLMQGKYYYQHPNQVGLLKKDMQTQIATEKLKTELYSIMPLQLLKAEKILGKEQFLQSLARLYKQNLFQSVSYQEFFAETNLTKEAITLD